jgi:hypothetical protein
MAKQYPAFATIQEWGEISGVGRSKTYELLAEGKLIARKLGARTLVDVHHGLAFMASLPALHPRHDRAAA